MVAIYAVWTGDEFTYCPTKGEAMAFAKRLAADADEGTVIDVTRNDIGLTGRELLCAALNGTGWVESRETVAKFQGKRKGAVE